MSALPPPLSLFVSWRVYLVSGVCCCKLRGTSLALGCLRPRRSAWDAFILLLVLYSTVLIPLDLGFRYDVPDAQFVWDTVVDVCFLLDVLLNFRTAYYRKDGELEMNSKAIAKNYLQTWFLLDAIASIPFDWFAQGASRGANGLAKMPRLLRIGRIMKQLDKFTSARAMRVVYGLLFFLLFTHIIACLWWRIGMSVSESGQIGWQFDFEVTPILLQDIMGPEEVQQEYFLGADSVLDFNVTKLIGVYENRVSLSKKYLTSMYWALTMVMKSPWLPPGSTAEQVRRLRETILKHFPSMAFLCSCGHATSHAFRRSPHAPSSWAPSPSQPSLVSSPL